ncbi:tyrosinase family protein [Flagellimonas marinaquae]|uniref:tyrosinase family protein n=1 Tax=Flagellimonas marinaquae TaxID=254955 RepID=UPI0020754E79|nr:tyrosinase family protein [Allomuricauda aquimarina]USD24810.1 tyrosinase family protein [Allomuricauda aquimarina]
MKQHYIFIIVFCWLFAFSGKGQSIRKNHLEMTDYEKAELVNAFYLLREGPDLIDDLADFHMDFFNFDNTEDPTRLDIHFNLMSEPERDIFLPWHRRQMFEMEQAIQDINPRISLGYWDSSTDQSVNSPLWDEDLMGSFDENWELGRSLGSPGGTLISPQSLANLVATTDFYEFSNDFERGRGHASPHIWTGGVMPTSASPRDPVFYFHHSFVDKVWHDWEEIHQGSFYLSQSMLRYDGTYVFDGQTLPLVNPNDIIDTRALGVFYAEDQLAELDNYIVSNTYNPVEYFYYQYRIEAGDNFIVPAGTACTFESVNEIELLPGFTAEPGSEFEMKIDTETAALTGKALSRVPRTKNPFDYIADLKPIVWEEEENDDSPVILAAFPNPFTEKITINLDKNTDCKIEVFNMMGMLVKEESYQNTNSIVINKLYGLKVGVYVVRVTDNSGKLLLAKRVIKL